MLLSGYFHYQLSGNFVESLGSNFGYLPVNRKNFQWADKNDLINIVFPVDFKTENKEKMGMAIFMGKYFDSKVHILRTVTKDKSLTKKTNINLNFAVKFLMQNNIDFEVHEVPHGKFAQQTIDFAQNIKADLIHIDAAHEYEPVLRDARLFWGLLNKGGVLVGDDFPWPGVAKAAQDFAAEIGQELVVESPKWILRKPR